MEFILGIIIWFLLIIIVLLLWRRRSDGQMTIEDSVDGVRRFSLELDRGPEDLAVKKVIRFRVVHK